jgi:hypothetical protein
MQARQPFKDHRRHLVHDWPASLPEDQLDSGSEEQCSSSRSSWSDTNYARDYTDNSYTSTQRQFTSSAASPSLVTRSVLEQLVFSSDVNIFAGSEPEVVRRDVHFEAHAYRLLRCWGANEAEFAAAFCTELILFLRSLRPWSHGEADDGRWIDCCPRIARFLADLFAGPNLSTIDCAGKSGRGLWVPVLGILTDEFAPSQLSTRSTSVERVRDLFYQIQFHVNIGLEAQASDIDQAEVANILALNKAVDRLQAALGASTARKIASASFQLEQWGVGQVMRLPALDLAFHQQELSIQRCGRLDEVRARRLGHPD